MSTSTAIARQNRPAAPAPRQQLRLVAPPSRRRPTAEVYRRRRLVAVLVVGLLVLAVAQLARPLVAPAAAGEPAREPVVLVAEPGDSYWSLAGEVHRSGDLRATVDALVDANGGRELRAGDRIVLAG